MAKTLTGVVTSNASDKTIVITVSTRKTHPLYKKQYTVTTKFMAHDEKNECSVGDKVVIVETRPLSARKRYILESIVEKAAISKADLDVIEKSAASESESPKTNPSEKTQEDK